MAKISRKEEQANSLRESIQASIDLAEAEHQRELFKRRLEMARKGLEAFKARQIPDAVRQFIGYIKILEKWKKSGEGGLSPTSFDLKRDAAELLLISQVYWNLAKVFDRSKVASNQKNFNHYLNQFVKFSKGMTFEPLSTELLRKFLKNDNPTHKSEFKKAFATLGGGKCFVVTSLLDHVEIESLESLWEYRDMVLSRSFIGRAMIRIYYLVGPSLARGLNHCPEFFRIHVAKFVTKIANQVRI